MKPRELRAARAVAPGRRTYWCLEGSQRKPTDYEVTSTALLYYPARGMAVETPTWQHYQSYQRSGRLRGEGWDSFEDPAHFTYSSYVAERRDQEVFLDRLLERPAVATSAELRPLLGLVSAWRFPLHGLQMASAYVGALAPSGRISIVAALQAADEMRRIQRLCQWLSRSDMEAFRLDGLGREMWQQSAAFQPLRRVVEELLVTWDWGEALVALNGVIKPIFDRLWFEQLVGSVKGHDEVMEKILSSLGEDARWHESWFVAFSQLSLGRDEGNAAHMRGIVDRWRPRVALAAQALRPAFEGLLADAGWLELERSLSAHLARAGIGTGSNAEACDEQLA